MTDDLWTKPISLSLRSA